MEKYCGDCKYFKLYENNDVMGYCTNYENKIRNKLSKSTRSKPCKQMVTAYEQ